MDIQQAFAELELPLRASAAEAKLAYRVLAMRWHPDINNTAEANARMKRINVAYALVCQHLETSSSSSSSARTRSAFAEFDWKTGFQVHQRAAAAPRTERVQRTVYVSLFEAAFGCVKRVSGMEPAPCPRCAGSGESPDVWTLGSKRPPCATCQGSGKTERRAWQVDVPIHAGTLDGAEVAPAEVRVHSSLHSVARSFQFTVHIEKHPLFRLDRDRLSVTVPISVWRWVQGGEITVPTLDGSVSVALPTRPAAILVKLQGWPEYKTPQRRKPLFVLPKIVFPESISAEERRMLQLLDVRSHLPEVQGWSRHVQAWVESPSPDFG